MDNPHPPRFRFRLRTLLVVVAIAAVACGVATRRTDPLLARKGMSRATVWWHCGYPAARTMTKSMTDWTYYLEPASKRTNVLTVRFGDDGVTQAHLIKHDRAYPYYEDIADNE
jgi:hypothetical protein